MSMESMAAAFSGGHDAIVFVQMLLDKGAYINSEGGKYGSALQASPLIDFCETMLGPDNSCKICHS